MLNDHTVCLSDLKVKKKKRKFLFTAEGTKKSHHGFFFQLDNCRHTKLKLTLRNQVRSSPKSNITSKGFYILFLLTLQHTFYTKKVH